MSRRRLLAMARKEWIHIRRDPRSLGVALGIPIALLLIMGFGINFDLADLRFALCDYDGSRTSRLLLESLSHTGQFDLVGMTPNARVGESLLAQRRCVFVLIIPPHMEADLARGKPVALQVLLDGSDANTATIARNYLQGALAQFSTDLLAEAGKRLDLRPTMILPPITVARKVLYNPALLSRQFVVPGLIVSILVILGALLTSGTVVRERERGTFETLAASPVLAIEILVGKLIPYLALGMFDVVTTITAGALVFHVYVAESVELLLGCAVVFLVCALGLGLLLSTLARTQQLAMLTAILATLLPSLLLSGFAFPVRSMPLLLRGISKLIPATHFLIVARDIYLKGVGLDIIWRPLLALVAFATVIFALAVARFRKRLD